MVVPEHYGFVPGLHPLRSIRKWLNLPLPHVTISEDIHDITVANSLSATNMN